MPIPVLIDTDPGIDDALALLLAFASPEISVEAITTVAGNVPVNVATVNVFRLLEVVDPPQRPRVGHGAGAPLRRELVCATHVHGDDGLGGLDRLRDPDGRSRYPAPALALDPLGGAELILDLAGRFPHRLVVVALGPLTNLAVALERNAPRLAQVAGVVVMGGAVRVPGNVTPAAEFNFYVDPDAAAAVLGARLPLRLVPLDATRQVVLRRMDLDTRLGRGSTRIARFVRDFTEHGFSSGAAHAEEGIILHDPLAVGWAIDSSLAIGERHYLEVETEGRLTRGMTLADLRPITRDRTSPPNCEVAMRVDAPRFLTLLLDRLCHPASA
jgi:inosine-uridine nucleoside N-ribohydrolase